MRGAIAFASIAIVTWFLCVVVTLARPAGWRTVRMQYHLRMYLAALVLASGIVHLPALFGLSLETAEFANDLLRLSLVLFLIGPRPPGRRVTAGELFDRVRALSQRAGTPVDAHVTMDPLGSGALQGNHHAIGVQPNEFEALSRLEVDALLAQQLIRLYDWRNSALILAVIVVPSAAVFYLSSTAHATVAQQRLMLLAVVAVTAVVTMWTLPGMLTRRDRRVAELTGEPDALVSALAARAKVQRAIVPRTYLTELAQQLAIPAERLPALLDPVLPRPAADRYPPLG